MYVPLSMLVPNGGDRHEKNSNRILHTSKHALKYALFQKSRLKCTSNTINNIALISMKQKSK